jgi:histone H1/5
MQANMGDKKWLNGVFLKALKDGVASGEFVKAKASYKLMQLPRLPLRRRLHPRRRPPLRRSLLLKKKK